MAPVALPCSGLLRNKPVQETLEIARRVTAGLGVSRLTDVGSGDPLGAPVWFAERPAGAVSTLHAGKGVTSLDAQVGALMEAIEYAVAERDAVSAEGEIWTLGEVVRQFNPPITLADLAPLLKASVTAAHLVLADTCEDVRTGRVYRMPAELLRVPAPLPADGGWRFGWSSNGLASGNSIEEATLHGLLEVLERDCIALDLVQRSTRWLELNSLPPPLDAWAAQWAELGVQLHVRHLSSEFGLPCFEACIVEQFDDTPRAAYGWGLHPSPALAAARAVTEAAQTRLHAQRDRSAEGQRPAEFPLGRVEAPTRQFIPLSDVHDVPCTSVSATLATLLERLYCAGLPWVLRRSMGCGLEELDLQGLAVVKVLVPGCESAISSELRVGRRLTDRLMRAV